MLLVEDYAPVRRAMARFLAHHGLDVDEATNGVEALELLATESFDVIVSDVAMPRMSGLELLRAIRVRGLELPVILLTGTADLADEAEAIGLG
ncbi:MAG: response regulator, partial [Deltaproteobacteria bacterium]